MFLKRLNPSSDSVSLTPQLDRAPAVRSTAVAQRAQPNGRMSNALLWLARLSTVGVLLAAPWLLGGVQYRVQVYLYAVVVAAMGLCVLSLLVGKGPAQDRSVMLPAALLPLVGGLLLGTMQVIPLGDLAPTFVANDAALITGKISLYPASTRLDLAQLTVAVTAFSLGVLLFSEKHAQNWLWGAVALNGAALAFLGIAKQIGPHMDVLGDLPGLRTKSFASYINKNNAAGYLNLCFAACVGWAFWGRGFLTREHSGQTRHSSRHSSQASTPRWLEAVRNMPSHLARLDGRILFALALAVVIVAGIACSLSRGGLVAVAFSILLIAATAIWKRGWVIGLGLAVLVLFFSVGLVRWVNLDRVATERASTLVDGRAANDARLGNWRDAGGVVRETWLTGTGLGTYRYAYLPHQYRLAESWFYHAENQFIEALVEGGILGLGLLLATITLVVLAVHSSLFETLDRHLPTVGLVGLVALASQGVQSLFDFGLYLPANMLTMAVLIGGVCGAAAATTRTQPQRPTIAFSFLRPTLVMLALVLLVNGGLAVREVSAAGLAEQARAELPRFAAADDAWNSQAVDRALEQAEQALRWRPHAAELHVAVGELFVQQFRQESLAKLQDSEFQYYYNRQQQWELTSPLVLHGRANRFYRAGQTRELDALRNDPLVKRTLVPAGRHFRAAKSACPILPRVDIQLAALAFLLEPNPAGTKYWKRAAALTPADPEILTQAGMLALNAGETSEACELWQQSLTLTPRHEPLILKLALEQLSADQIASELVPASPEYILQLIRNRFSDDGHVDLRKRLLARMDQLMSGAKGQMPLDSWSYLHGTLDRMQNRPEQAVDHLRRAVDLSPKVLEWRLELVKALRDQGRIEEARQEAGIGALMSRGRKDIETLRQQLIEAEIRQ